MADKKPEVKKPSSGGSNIEGHMFEWEIKIFLVIAFVVFLYITVGRPALLYFGYGTDVISKEVNNSFDSFFSFFNWLFNMIMFFSVFLILFFISGYVYLRMRHKEIVTLYRTGLLKGFVSSLSSTTVSKEDSKPVVDTTMHNEKWLDIERHMSTMNVSDWRMAILEADILLYDMLDKMGYSGETVADKLKGVEPSDFNTLDSAWRAHKVRNIIAHEGSSYELSYQQAQNTIDLYRKVFDEFYFI